ncbi:MAG: preprotein translocase subunit SecY [Xanthomonadales bacterium]|nr:preprotein translocase subunit SecY [Gammaproteobacteria bacterium]MBT8056782.1 preprotein translocase subunit SecY [Gammaproteobacteria bacterium]NNJ77873.1 preprotein translocase subunit SecY [Xanthomonadales bacterium]NNL04454.1 preprotein translocase subunit SecY [Xanthomonadales bacterium]
MGRSPSQMAETLSGLGRLTELRQRLLFVFAALIIYRIGTFIPVPGVNPQALLQFMNSQQGTIVDVFNLFTGGALERFSLFALGVMPYISASIIMQLMSSAVPQLQQLKKEGSSGRQKITQYTRNFTVILAAIQAGGVAFALQGQSSVVLAPGFGFLFTAIVSLTAGTVFLMWLGEQITERGVGNGISLIIFAGIVAGLPRAVAGTLELVNTGQLSIPATLIILVLVLAVIYFIVRVERGQRRITVNYAQRQGRVAYQNQSTHLPLKVNMSGVIPAIFASSIVIFPSTLATWFSGSEGLGFLTDVSAALTPGNLAYTILFSGLIIFFCFFYTAMVFNSKETADNLKRSGAFIPGIRPGRQTAEYIDHVLTRLTMVGSIYLVAVCLLPDIFRVLWQVPFYFGGTSVLIVVVVIMDFIAQIQAHLISHQYDSLMKKANLKSYGRSGVVRR